MTKENAWNPGEYAQPLVSVIITTYRNEAYLPRAVESVLYQTYQNIELIVVDDNQPGTEERCRTEAVMAQYPQAVYIRHPENRNGAAARNTGINVSRGKYIAFLDNDDFYFSTHIADCVDALAHNPACSAVLCGVIKICGGVVWDRILPKNGEDFARELLFSETALGTGSNLFVDAFCVRAIGGFDEHFFRHQDIEFGLRYFSRYKAVTRAQVSIVKEMEGYSNAPDYARFLLAKQMLWEKFSDMLAALSKEDAASYFAGQYGALLYAACKGGNREQIAEAAAKRTQYKPLGKKERLLLACSRANLFPIYEAEKRIIKQMRSKTLQKETEAQLSEEDRARLRGALGK